MSVVKANGHEIELSNPEKMIFPKAGMTKKGLVDYYMRISEYILPHLKDRPLMLHRYPNGIKGKEFYQKEEPDYFPGWIHTIDVEVKKEGQKTQKFVNCNSESTLAYIANQASITPHVWLSRKDKLHHPDKLIYDLEPPEGEFEVVKECARDFKKLFDELDLTAYLMTTGSKGMHLALPLDREWDFKKVREFAKRMAGLLAESKPDKYTVETLKKKRKGRLFLDYLRNSHGQTSVAPYSLRAREEAPVAVPLEWDELGKTDSSQKYNAGNIFRRMSRKKDPWKDFFSDANSLGRASKAMNKL